MCGLVEIQNFFKSNIALAVLIFLIFTLVSSPFMVKFTKPLLKPIKDAVKVVNDVQLSWIVHLAVAGIITLLVLNYLRPAEPLKGNAGKTGKNLPGFF